VGLVYTTRVQRNARYSPMWRLCSYSMLMTSPQCVTIVSKYFGPRFGCDGLAHRPNLFQWPLFRGRPAPATTGRPGRAGLRGIGHLRGPPSHGTLRRNPPAHCTDIEIGTVLIHFFAFLCMTGRVATTGAGRPNFAIDGVDGIWNYFSA